MDNAGEGSASGCTRRPGTASWGQLMPSLWDSQLRSVESTSLGPYYSKRRGCFQRAIADYSLILYYVCGLASPPLKRDYSII
jgi:hypothetical protein